MCASQVRPSHRFDSKYKGSGHGVVERVVAPRAAAAANVQVNRTARSRIPVASSLVHNFPVLGLSTIRVVRTLLLIAIVILLRFVPVLSLDLSMIFVIVALVTRVVAAVVPFRKKIQGRKRHSGVLLVPRTCASLWADCPPLL